MNLLFLSSILVLLNGCGSRPLPAGIEDGKVHSTASQNHSEMEELGPARIYYQFQPMSEVDSKKREPLYRPIRFKGDQNWVAEEPITLSIPFPEKIEIQAVLPMNSDLLKPSKIEIELKTRNQTVKLTNHQFFIQKSENERFRHFHFDLSGIHQLFNSEKGLSGSISAHFHNDQRRLLSIHFFVRTPPLDIQVENLSRKAMLESPDPILFPPGPITHEDQSYYALGALKFTNNEKNSVQIKLDHFMSGNLGYTKTTYHLNNSPCSSQYWSTRELHSITERIALVPIDSNFLEKTKSTFQNPIVNSKQSIRVDAGKSVYVAIVGAGKNLESFFKQPKLQNQIRTENANMSCKEVCTDRFCELGCSCVQYERVVSHAPRIVGTEFGAVHFIGQSSIPYEIQHTQKVAEFYEFSVSKSIPIQWLGL